MPHQAPLSMGFSRQEYWSGLPFPSPGDLPDPGIKPKSPALADRFFTIEPSGKPICYNKLTGFPDGSVVKNLPANEEDLGSIPGLGRSPGEGNGKSLQYSCLGNSMDRAAWWLQSMGSQLSD